MSFVAVGAFDVVPGVTWKSPNARSRSNDPSNLLECGVAIGAEQGQFRRHFHQPLQPSFVGKVCRGTTGREEGIQIVFGVFGAVLFLCATWIMWRGGPTLCGYILIPGHVLASEICLVGDVTLREVSGGDLPVFFKFESDPDAVYMAAFTAKNPDDREAFNAHWKGILGEGAVIVRTILLDGFVVGSVASFVDQGFGKREVPYWVGREYWGKGIFERG